MSYRQTLDEAIGDAPVSTVDVDRIIVRQRRARTFRTWGGGTAGAAAVLAVTLGASLLPGPTTSGVQPAATAGTGVDQQRLDDVVVAALKRAVPGITFPEGTAPELSGWPGDRDLGGTASQTSVQRAIAVDGVRGTILVSLVEHVPTNRAASFTCEPTTAFRAGPATSTPGSAPSRTVTPPGGVVVEGLGGICRHTFGTGDTEVTLVDRSRPNDTRSYRFGGVTVLRGSATVIVQLASEMPQDRLPLTADQMTAVAADPALDVDAPPLGAEQQQQQEKIDKAVIAALRGQAPDVQAVGPDGNGVDLESQWTHGQGNIVDSYWGQAQILVDDVPGFFKVNISRGGAALTCERVTAAQRCVTGNGPNGEWFRITTQSTKQGSNVSVTRDIVVLRDGALITVRHDSGRPDGAFALTEQQQKAIALDPTLALPTR
ncbi:hypothetical protein AB0H63_11290 [Micromonospora echinospora]|uniref:hypothetical protein n=1 Tax=Micromonospora echinospora TaxID=1877 RepID=UPI0033E0FE53